MPEKENATERWQNLLQDTSQDLDLMLENIRKTRSDINSQILSQLVKHHLNRTQESATALCKLLEKYREGNLDNETVMSIELWT